MRRFTAVLSLLVLSTAAAQAAGEFVPGEILVKVRGGVSPQAIAGIQADANADGDEHVGDVVESELRKLHIRGNVADALRALSGNSSVEYAQPNYILHADLTPNDTR